jgi:methylated-DNA-[protein]-cysteine S-methyltransferase
MTFLIAFLVAFALESSMLATIAQHTTPLGKMWATWTEQGLFGLNWEMPDVIEQVPSNTTKARMTQLKDCLETYFAMGQESFSKVVLDPSGWAPFTTKVYQRCRNVKPGETRTYKELANMAGNEKASRAVGAAMSRNRTLLVIPCHRVIAGSGQLRGFSAPGGLTTKRQLLELERQHCWPTDLFDCATNTQ